MPLELLVVLVACLFAVVSGMNDGGALLATGLKLPSVRPATGIATIVVLIAVVPVLSHRVAETFVTKLAGFDGEGGRQAMMLAVVSALAVVMVLSRQGRPTSLTLAIVGALTGAGLGWGLPVSVGWVVLVLAVGFASPFAGALASWAALRLLTVGSARGLHRWHRAAFLLESVAYAANDGQKMLAIFMIAMGLSGAPLWVTALSAALFAAGALYGMPRAGRTLSREILASRPLHGVAAELGAGVTVIVCAAVGMPVSMTQAIAGGLIGAGVAQGTGRVRWHAALKIVSAWTLTLPVSLVIAFAGASFVKEVLV
ncbi:inorganic phosphate transporter [Nonomuraea soli]|uniref:PiT family inorganic phosphate transporter n=1 Tax=Nonomuraea soli TaxID=1032476 RepID=A0A7W0CLY1_9ACTN|nr:inorganic phosphate transporter [Nonomuraea soli]MBA2893459.1 PiT family inorganic phosphate transporter [Nonomuraea soli]